MQLMRTPPLTLGIMLAMVTVGCGQAPQAKKLPSECTPVALKRGSFPKGPFEYQPGESYKRSPVLKFEIKEDGTVTSIRITRSSGVTDIDRKVTAALRNWKYKPRPGCGTVESETTVTIDWR
jgi:TonB family protein